MNKTKLAKQIQDLINFSVLYGADAGGAYCAYSSEVIEKANELLISLKLEKDFIVIENKDIDYGQHDYFLLINIK